MLSMSAFNHILEPVVDYRSRSGRQIPELLLGDVIAVQIVLLAQIHPAAGDHRRCPGWKLVALNGEARDLLIAGRSGLGQTHHAVLAQEIQLPIRISDRALSDA